MPTVTAYSNWHRHTDTIFCYHHCFNITQKMKGKRLVRNIQRSYVKKRRSVQITSSFNAELKYTRQQKKCIFLLPRFTSLKVMIFYLVNMTIGLAAFSGHNAISRKNMLIFIKKVQNHKILTHCVKEPYFQCNSAAGKRYKTLENLTLMQFYLTCKNLHFLKFFKVFENRLIHQHVGNIR